MMKIKKKDFIEIEFTGKTKNGEVFDSTLKEELEKFYQSRNQEDKPQAKPFVFCVGQGMFLKALDDFLIDKEVGKEYEKELSPENAFGKRKPEFIQRIPARIFKEKGANPFPGASFNFDGRIGKVLAVSGGRIMVDFNHPLSGKNVIYKIKILRKIDNLNEKVKALNEFFFKKDLKFEIKEKEKKIIFKSEKPFVKIVELFKDKFKEILGFDVEIREVKEEKGSEEAKEEKKEKSVELKEKKLSEKKTNNHNNPYKSK